MRVRNISLFGLLAFVTCAAIGISHAITSLRLVRANAELAALRKRLELIEVKDTDHIAARRLPSAEKNVHRWAIRLPDAKSKLLYANWGSSQLSGIRDITAKSARVFELDVDSDTHEATIAIRANRNPNDPKWGTLHVEHGGGSSVIAIDPQTTSLLMGDMPSRSEAIGDSPTTRTAASPITLFAIESTGDPKFAFCLWLDKRNEPDGG
jgi:hypothetical protein